MIQRKQTLYLLLLMAFGIMLLMNSRPVAIGIYNEGQVINLKMMKVQFFENGTEIDSRLSGYLVYSIMLSMGIALLAILMFKKRALQLRLVSFNFIFLLLIPLSLFLEGKSIQSAFETQLNWGISWMHYMGYILMCIMNFMALRGIVKDIDLIRSVDRLR